MIFVYLFVVLFTLSSCVKDSISLQEKNTPVVSESSSADGAKNIEVTPDTEGNLSQDTNEYLAKDKSVLSELDFETAFEMCVRALTDYYKAVWNGTDIEWDTFIDNENLKQYTQKKIQSQYDVYAQFEDKVQNIKIGTWEVEYTDDVDEGYLWRLNFMLNPIVINGITVEMPRLPTISSMYFTHMLFDLTKENEPKAFLFLYT